MAYDRLHHREVSGQDGPPHLGQIVTAPTNHQCLGGELCTTSMEGCQH